MCRQTIPPNGKSMREQFEQEAQGTYETIKFCRLSSILKKKRKRKKKEAALVLKVIGQMEDNTLESNQRYHQRSSSAALLRGINNNVKQVVTDSEKDG